VTERSERYDAILIGSGIGALTSASLLAQLGGKRVLVLERHFKVGGFTHDFTRKGKYSWDVGVHYVGEMAEGGMPRAMFDLITAGGVTWKKLPETYDSFDYPDGSFAARAGRERFRDDLIARFPHERDAIERYLADGERAAAWFSRYSMSLALPRQLSWLAPLFRARGAGLALTTTGRYLERTIADPTLRGLLASQWGNYGLPPAESAFVTHAMLAAHYLDGGYYPVGGAGTIADSIVPIVEAQGGAVLVNRHVERILVENGRAVGVEVTHRRGKRSSRERYLADVVISNAGSHATYTRLLPPEHRPPFAADLDRLATGTSNVTLFLGLKDDPRTVGLGGGNRWIYDGYDHDAIWDRRNDLIEGEVHHAYLSFPSSKNPEARGHTAEILAFMDAEPFRTWAALPWKRRGEAYEALKKKVTDALIAFVEARWPGFAELIDYAELGTPLTTETFTGHRGGAIYGLPATPERFRHPAVSPRTPIRNLYLVGADAAMHGILGSMMVSAAATGMVLGGVRGVMQVFSRANALRSGVRPSGSLFEAEVPAGTEGA
jgi:phytoene dehydrogenase-like protein